MYIDFVTTVRESPCNKKLSSAALNPVATLKCGATVYHEGSKCDFINCGPIVQRLARNRD